MKNFLVFDGKNIEDFGVFVSGSGTYGGAERDVDLVEVPGRNGALMYDKKKYKNVRIVYNSCIKDKAPKNLEGLRVFFLSTVGYKRLADTFHPEEYRMARFVGALDPDMSYRHNQARFDLEFDCKPQRFLLSGERKQVFTGQGEIYNPTLFVAKPLVRVYGTGTLVIGHQTIVISKAGRYTDIDCDIQDAYMETENCNPNLRLDSGEFFELQPGVTGIKFEGGITGVEITPRWWTL